MPHSNDRTVVSCAGDSEVRVFDLEYGGATDPCKGFASNTRSRRFNDFFGNARWLNESNTNARVYRSHADRAKRVVTESSPHLFLTCSEDGEVRQWDLRMPSSAYPAPREGRGFPSRFRRNTEATSDNVPPPLISYKKYNLDLNSISCAASQPQYIALGGAHLHCFLHDRRMLGRDRSEEAGQPGGPKPTVGTYEDESMGEATRCVKRFAPNNKRRAGHDRRHITACKISDANPNEMVASWSGDYIYSFDIVKSPDARDKDLEEDVAFHSARLKNQTDRKRKRKKAAESTSSLAEHPAPPRRLRRVSDTEQEHGQTALRVRYENGETDELSLASELGHRGGMPNHDALLTEAQQVSERVARSLVQLRKTMFDFSASMGGDTPVAMENSSELTPHTSTFTQALGECSTLLPEMDEVMRTWSYPMNPSEHDVSVQNTLRRNRQAAWRYVQASGCLSRVLGGKLQTLSTAPDPRLAQFATIKPATHEGRNTKRESRFCYDFLKAILCWLDGGQAAVLQAFKWPSYIPTDSPRFPLTDTADFETSVSELRDYLTELADDDRPIVDLETNRFERDDTRHLFASQKDAVNAFVRALTGIQLEMRQGISEFRNDTPSSGTAKRVMDKGAAARFWGIKVGRSLLMEAADGVTFDFVNRAFGGLQSHIPDIEAERSQEDIDPEERDRIVEAIDVVITDDATSTGDSRFETSQSAASSTTATTNPDTIASPSPSNTETPRTVVVETVEEEAVDEDDNIPQDSDEDEEDGSDDGEEDPAQALFRRRMFSGASRQRAGVNSNVPYSSHTRVYKGHCNTRTVKDVNFYGLNDEYVVSGSDDGHFFIWDRKTCKIVNILEGDGEVVNVIQGHPYEPMIACSGIDSTIKIFGPGDGSRDREAASQGINVANPGGSVHSSLGGRRRRRTGDSDDEDDQQPDSEGITTNGLRSRKAMHKEYEITSQNDVERQRDGTADMTVSSMDLFFTRAWIMSGLGVI